jgi:hypothetical protein
VLEAFTAIGAYAGDRDPEDALAVVEACSGRVLADLREVLAATARIRAGDFGDRGLAGPALGQAIRDAREQLIVGAIS